MTTTTTTATTVHLTCDMHETCTEPVAMIDTDGYVYCAAHGIDRRGSGFYRRPVRKLRPHELNKLRRGEQLARY